MKKNSRARKFARHMKRTQPRKNPALRHAIKALGLGLVGTLAAPTAALAWQAFEREPTILREYMPQQPRHGTGGVPEGADMIDLTGSLRAVSLSFQLVSASPSAGDGTVSPDIRPVFTLGTVPASPGGSGHHGQHEHRHTTGSRALASTSGSLINLSSSSASGAPTNYTTSDTISILVPDNTEYVRNAATDRIIEEALMVAARQPVYFPPRANRADWSIYRSIP